MENLINVQFFQHLGLLATIILGLTFFKVKSCKPFKEDGEPFDFKKLVIGLLGNLLVAAAISLVYSAGCLWGADLVAISVEGTQLTIPDALNLILVAAIGIYGAKFLKNFSEMMGIKKKIEAIDVIKDENYGTDEEAKG